MHKSAVLHLIRHWWIHLKTDLEINLDTLMWRKWTTQIFNFLLLAWMYDLVRLWTSQWKRNYMGEYPSSNWSASLIIKAKSVISLYAWHYGSWQTGELFTEHLIRYDNPLKSSVHLKKTVWFSCFLFKYSCVVIVCLSLLLPVFLTPQRVIR